MSVDTAPGSTPSERRAISLFRRDIVRRALIDSLVKLDPRVQIRNPVMFVVEIGAVITTVTWLIQVFGGKPLGGGHEPAWYTFTISFWLWLTVVFANMAEAFAEGRGRAQADTLRTMRQETVATLQDGTTKQASELTKGDVVVVEAGELIPGDGTVIEGIASVDESAITGESAPVIRESGGDRSAVTGGTRVLSDRIVVEITQEPGHSFLDRMIALVEGAAAAQDAERDRAEHPARRPDLDLHDRRRDAAAVRAVRGHADLRDDADLAAGRADPDHDRRAALGDRDRRHGPARAPQRARALRPRGRGLRRRRRAAARQDRHDHDRQPPRVRVHPDARRHRGRARRGRAAVLARRRDPGGPLDRRAGQAVRHPRARHGRAARAVRAVHRADADERRRPRRPPAAQGRRRRGDRVRHRRGRPAARRAAARARPDRPRGRHAARGRARLPGAGRRSTSRTRSRRACASASTTSARWASARS